MHTVTLDAVDITALCLDTIEVTRQERVAARAAFTYAPDMTPLLPLEMVRKNVTIDWDGERIFTGRVNSAVWSPKNRRYAIEASDLFQEYWETKTNSEILGLIPGSYYSENVFGVREDGWQVARDCMATVPLDVHLSRAGALVTKAWSETVVADFVLTAATILNDGAYQLKLAKARELATRHVITFDYRVSRWKLRKHSFQWRFDQGTGPSDWCDWARNWGFNMPTREVIEAAAGGTGWAVATNEASWFGTGVDGAGFIYDTHPPSGTYCGTLQDGLNWFLTDEAALTLVIRASWTGFRHWAQTVTENYTITMDVPAMQTDLGVIVTEERSVLQIEADDASFEANPIGAAAGWPLDSLGDAYDDQDDETNRVNDLSTLINMGNTKLRELARRNSVRVEGEIRPAVELAEILEINTPDIQAKGKLQYIQHRITLERATTVFEVAISQGGGGVQDPLVVPARPDTSPSHTAPPSTSVLGLQVGGCGDSPDFDDNIDGWSTNHPQTVIVITDDPDGGPPIETPVTRPTCSTPGDIPTPEQLYPYRFKVVGPDIEDEARDDVDGVSVSTINVGIPQDTLVLL